ncbi:hypothetical protein INT45_000639 [Circinella minor]|uniref:Rab-like protein 6 n=1 Tax=Circinella minor TaxID=1195481 RepID=A0A8H7S0H4_9FUNG|nr:hypothetical protein INT45_000639 [Circinella minor]
MSFLWSFGSSSKKEPTGGGGSPITGSTPDQQQQQQQQQTFKTMSTAFRKGVTYNMKIVIRGDVMTGKSTLFNRLQGSEFEEIYKSTPEIQVANIPWQYKDSNDVIKVEVWDVVDKAHNKPSLKNDTGIKLEHNTPSKTQQQQQQSSETASNEQEQLGLDASTVNVYRNTHAALFIFDITKQWTFDYVNNELMNVPEDVSILVLGNFSDKSVERVVSLEMIHATLYQHNQERIEKNAIKPNLIRYAETSMKTGLGLQYIYDYLGVPFLQLQMESFKKQLELKATEIVETLENLDTSDKVPELMRRRRGQDNFDQPSEPHLARQHEELKNAWDQELEDIATDNPTTLEIPTSPSFVRKETPPPPTAPVRGRRREGSLASDSERMPAAVDQFDAGELADDWFGDDNTNDTPVFGINNKKQDSDNEDYGRNPMVAGDEDVETVEYYDTGITSSRQIETNQQSEKEEEKEQEKANDPGDNQVEEDDEEDQYGAPPVFRSELSDVWSSSTMIHDHQQHHFQRPGHTLLMGQTARIESDSEDEDNSFSPQSQPPLSSPSIDQPDIPISSGSPFMTGSGFGGYEEIGGDNDNPWSWDDQQKEQEEGIKDQTQEKNESWADTENQEPQEIIQEQENNELIEEISKKSLDKGKGKKKATNNSNSGTKKKKSSKDGKKKKKKTATSP